LATVGLDFAAKLAGWPLLAFDFAFAPNFAPRNVYFWALQI